MNERYEVTLVIEVDGDSPKDAAAIGRAVTHDQVDLAWIVKQGGELLGVFYDNAKTDDDTDLTT